MGSHRLWVGREAAAHARPPRLRVMDAAEALDDADTVSPFTIPASPLTAPAVSRRMEARLVSKEEMTAEEALPAARVLAMTARAERAHAASMDATDACSSDRRTVAWVSMRAVSAALRCSALAEKVLARLSEAHMYPADRQRLLY